MAGKRNPWDKPKGSGDGDSEPASGEGSGGPRNPWLPPKGNGGEPPRRSASIEDLFKNRGPEGPRRVGGPGGPGFRFPERPDGRSYLPYIIGGLVVKVGSKMIDSSIRSRLNSLQNVMKEAG